MPLRLSRQPLSSRPFRGLGVEADAYIFDDVNREAGVTDEDLALIERRVRALRPAVARLFVEVPWFNPALDGTTLRWGAPAYGHLVRQLRLLAELGTAVNLVLFQPTTATPAQFSGAIRAMVAMLERLRTVEGVSCVRWLTLWNEPDSLFLHDSPLSRRVFGEKRLAERPPWSEYVRLNREACGLLHGHGLSDTTRLVVADTVWGAPIRRERLQLACEAFGDLDVDFSYHNYNPEDQAFYAGNPDFAYPGMSAEARTFRELLGPYRELMLWEFNTAGLAGFGSHFPGAGPAGVDQIGSIAGAVDVAAKVLQGAAAGLDGFCLWCLHDMFFCHSTKAGLMNFGLWRWKQQGWLPRPVYHYYAALMQAFRPGMRLYGVRGAGSGLVTLAGERAGECVLAVLNPGERPARVTLPPRAAPCRIDRRRVYPGILPAAADLPVSVTETVAATADVPPRVALEPRELSLFVLPGR